MLGCQAGFGVVGLGCLLRLAISLILWDFVLLLECVYSRSFECLQNPQQGTTYSLITVYWAFGVCLSLRSHIILIPCRA